MLLMSIYSYPFSHFNEYRVKVTSSDNTRGTLVGVLGFRQLVNDDVLAARLVERAIRSLNDKTVCKLRRGLCFIFYNK